MGKFKVGDRVTVRKDLHVGSSDVWGDNSVISDMLEYAGKTFTISQVIANGHYCLEEIPWGWTDKMFEDVESEGSKMFKIGDKVTLKKGLVEGMSYNGILYYHVKYFDDVREITLVDYFDNTYKVSGCDYWYSFEMLDLANEPVYTVNLVYVKFDHNEKPYLYEVPVGVTISKDDMIFIETRSGETYVKAFTDSFSVGVGALDAIKLSAGIGLNPLKKVVGRAKQTYKKVEF